MPRLLIFILLVLLAPAFAGAQTNSVTNIPPTRVNGVVERAYRSISDAVIEAGDNLDRFIMDSLDEKDAQQSPTFYRFFGDRRIEEDDKATRVRVSPSIEARDGSGVKPDVRFGLQIALPRTQDRLQLVVDNFRDDTDLLDEALRRPTPAERDEEGNGGASLRLRVRDTTRSSISFDAGARFKPGPVLRSRLRFRAWREWGNVLVRGTQNFFWEQDDGFGEKSQFDLEHGSPSQNLARASTYVLWSQSSDGVKLGEVFGFYHFLSHRGAIGVKAGVSGHVEPSAIVDTYTVQFPFRRRLNRNWLYLELVPGVDFPNDHDFNAKPFIELRFDFIFGRTEEED